MEKGAVQAPLTSFLGIALTVFEVLDQKSANTCKDILLCLRQNIGIHIVLLLFVRLYDGGGIICVLQTQIYMLTSILPLLGTMSSSSFYFDSDSFLKRSSFTKILLVLCYAKLLFKENVC